MAPRNPNKTRPVEISLAAYDAISSLALSNGMSRRRALDELLAIAFDDSDDLLFDAKDFLAEIDRVRAEMIADGVVIDAEKILAELDADAESEAESPRRTVDELRAEIATLRDRLIRAGIDPRKLDVPTRKGATVLF